MRGHTNDWGIKHKSGVVANVERLLDYVWVSQVSHVIFSVAPPTWLARFEKNEIILKSRKSLCYVLCDKSVYYIPCINYSLILHVCVMCISPYIYLWVFHFFVFQESKQKQCFIAYTSRFLQRNEPYRHWKHVSKCLSICLFVCLSVFLAVCLFIVCLFCLSVCWSVPSVCPEVRAKVCPSVCLPSDEFYQQRNSKCQFTTRLVQLRFDWRLRLKTEN